MKKQDTEQDDTNAPAAFGFGKVLSSLQGLQQRLGDFSYGEVSIAEAKVKILVKQLSLLRDSLSQLVWLKRTVSDVNRRANEISVVNFDHVGMSALENHPQLHAILEASKLVRRQELTQGDFTESYVDSLNKGIADTPDLVSAGKETGADTAIEPTGPMDEPVLTEATESANGPAEAPWLNDARFFTLHSVAPKTNKTPLPSEKLPSFTIPRETIAALRDSQVGGRAKDWSFDRPEAALTASGNSTAPFNFEFPDETKDALEPFPEKSKKTKSAVSEPLCTAPLPHGVANKKNAVETKAAVAAAAIPIKPAPEPLPAKLAASQALVPAKQDIDQRLLEDVIKNYGDFAGAPNLPATLDTNTKIVPVTETPEKKPTAEFAAPTAAERKILNVQKSGDLDRQLKKIIKDYGEYDIYQRKTGISFKTGGIIAFAVLGLVLAVLYLFQSPTAVSTPQPGSVKQSQRPQVRNSLEAVGGPAVDARPMSPHAADVSSGPLKDDQQ